VCGNMLNLKLSIISKPPLLRCVTISFNYYRVVNGGNWTTPDLVKYLVSTKSLWTTNDSAEFRRIPVFPEEATAGQKNEGGTPKRFKASDLYEPLDVFRNLGLPIIDWQGKGGKYKWRSSSKEGIPDIV